MDVLPDTWAALAAVVLLLGLKHGFDADHLATIDGLTRVTRRTGAAFSPWCGALFSLGHGAVVLTIAAAVGSASERWEVPGWLATSGAWISIIVLTLLGVFNVRAVLTAPRDEVVEMVGLRGRLFGRVASTRSPWVVAAIGAAFALSFDTISQAALFSAAAVRFGGLRDSLTLGTVFLAGMLLTDGINGLWVSRLIARADALARVASRVMGLAVGGVSLLVATLGIGRLAAPRFTVWIDGHEVLLGVVVVGAVLASFLIGRRLAAVRPASRAGYTARPECNDRGTTSWNPDTRR